MIIFLNIIALLGAIGWMISDFGWEPILVFIGFLTSFIILLKPKKKSNNILWFLGGLTAGAIVVSEGQKKTKNFEEDSLENKKED